MYTKNFTDNCAFCGGQIDIENPNGLWIQKTCANCDCTENGPVDLSEIIDRIDYLFEDR